MSDNIFYRLWQYEKSQDVFNGKLDVFLDIENLTFQEFCNNFNKEFSNKFYNDYKDYGLDKFDKLPDSIKQKMLSAFYYYHFMLNEYEDYGKSRYIRDGKTKSIEKQKQKIEKLKNAIEILQEISKERFENTINEIEALINELNDPDILDKRKKQVCSSIETFLCTEEYLTDELIKINKYQPSDKEDFIHKENRIKNIQKELNRLNNKEKPKLLEVTKQLENSILDKPQKPKKEELLNYLTDLITKPMIKELKMTTKLQNLKEAIPPYKKSK
jgi:hypothetical protein